MKVNKKEQQELKKLEKQFFILNLKDEWTDEDYKLNEELTNKIIKIKKY